MKAAIYARVSSEKQEVDLSISAQLKALHEYAAKQGHEVVTEFIDEAESGRTADRPQFMCMVAAAKRKERPFSLILVWKFSRFARSREDSIVFKALLRKYGVQVVSINEPTEDTPTGKLFEAMIESMDEFYSANLGQEVTRGMRESASRGFYVSAKAPYGYQKVRVNDGGKQRFKLEPVSPEAEVVKRIFSEYLRGMGVMGIVRALNGEGIASPYRKGWSKTQVHKILNSEVYTGTLLWCKTSIRQLSPIRVENAWPALVDKAIFNTVQRMLGERGPKIIHPRRASSRYLLSGLARCGHCGKALGGRDAKSGKNKYYICGTILRKGPQTCAARYIPSKKLEHAVIDKIRERILTEANLMEMVRLVNEEIDTANGSHYEHLGTIDAELKDIKQRLTRHYEALESGKLIQDDLAPRIHELRESEKALQVTKWELEASASASKVQLADERLVREALEDLREMLNDSPLCETRAFIRSFVKEVKVTGGEVVLTYTMPTSQGLLEEAIPVLPTVKYGGRYRTRTCDPLRVKHSC
ncbi:recombinase family protein [Chloroflexota bacterium]